MNSIVVEESPKGFAITSVAPFLNMTSADNDTYTCLAHDGYMTIIPNTIELIAVDPFVLETVIDHQGYSPVSN